MTAFLPIIIQFVFVVDCVVANLRHPSSLTTNNYMETIAQFLKSENIFLTTVLDDHLTRLQDHSNRISQLEALYLSGCDSSKSRYPKVENFSDRLNSLEEKLNFTLIENEDLRRELMSLKMNLANSIKDESPKKGKVQGLLHRTTRNFSPGSESQNEDFATPIDPLNEIEDVQPNSRCKPTVAFDAYRNKPFKEPQKYVTFDGTTVNIGNAFNPKTGEFVAPHKGVYAFSFHGLTMDGTATYVKIVQNGRNVGGAYRRHEGEGDEEHDSMSNFSDAGLRRAEGMLAQSVLLDLDEGDKVAVFAYHGNLRDGGWHYTHFTGYLI